MDLTWQRWILFSDEGPQLPSVVSTL